MKRIFAKSLFLFFIPFLSYASDLKNAIDGVISQLDPNMNIGIVVKDLYKNQLLYTRSQDKPFIPASNMKLFSNAAALIVLGPDYRFQTELSTNASKIEKGVLKGDLFVKFSGDPSLSQAELGQLFQTLTLYKVKKIEGNVILVSPTNSISPYAKGVVPADLTYGYGAPAAPLILDENRLNVTVNPACMAEKPAIIEYSDASASILINNQVKTKNQKNCQVSFLMDKYNTLTLRGCVSLYTNAIQQQIPIKNPFKYAATFILHDLARKGIQLNGSVVLGNASKLSMSLKSHYSKPLGQLIAKTLKHSDNLYADSLFLHTARKLYGAPVDWEKAQIVLTQFFEHQLEINMKQARLIDGSGLSREDLLTPAQTVNLLSYLYYHFPLSYEFIVALPISGQDGTLQKRLKKPSQQGLVRAKTGTMSGVIGLSGYLYTANAHTLAFSIYINRTPHTKAKVVMKFRSLIDELCSFFLKQSIKTEITAEIPNAHDRVLFQSQDSESDKQRKQYGKWRNLEYSLKVALKGQPVTILFRGNQIILQDHSKTIDEVWSVLQTLNKKYTFAVTLSGITYPSQYQNSPFLLWDKDGAPPEGGRIWTIQGIS